jgi:hypothetical protein
MDQPTMLCKCTRCPWIGPAEARGDGSERCPRCRGYAPVWQPDLAQQTRGFAEAARAAKAERHRLEQRQYHASRATVEAHRRAARLEGV